MNVYICSYFTQDTLLACPLSLRVGRPDATSHKITDLSELPDRICELSHDPAASRTSLA